MKICSVLVLLLVLTTNVFALSASIGNAKAILRPEFAAGETHVIERTILVRNINDISVMINLEAKGDLLGMTEIIDEEFELLAGEEKDARFKITLEEHGTFEGDIAVSFTPLEGDDNGVGLLSNMIILTQEVEPTEPVEPVEPIEPVEPVEPEEGANPLMGLGIAVLIILVGLVLFRLLKRGKKSKKPGRKKK